jgi:hypothetical protein
MIQLGWYQKSSQVLVPENERIIHLTLQEKTQVFMCHQNATKFPYHHKIMFQQAVQSIPNAVVL